MTRAEELIEEIEHLQEQIKDRLSELSLEVIELEHKLEAVELEGDYLDEMFSMHATK
jgi:hypothetical protein